MQIVCATDGNYLRHCVAMLQSLYQHNPRRDLSVYLIFDDADSAQLARAVAYLNDLLPSFSLLQASAEPLEGFPVNGHVTVASYFRLLLPELLPSSCDRILFIDADTIINSCLDELWQLSLHDKALAAVPEHRLYCRDHGHIQGEYFNAGIMLIDLQKWRTANLLERGRELVKTHPDQLRHSDQDVLNLLFRGDWLALDDRWNACPHLYGLNNEFIVAKEQLTEAEKVAITDPAIIHFAGPGPLKPWNARCQHPLKERYLEAKAETPWASTPLDDSPPPAWKSAINDTIFRSKWFLKDRLGRLKSVSTSASKP